jgi:hypothetical protein
MTSQEVINAPIEGAQINDLHSKTLSSRPSMGARINNRQAHVIDP